jgi:hypothetical protein
MLYSHLGQIRTDRDIDSEVNVDRDIRHGGIDWNVKELSRWQEDRIHVIGRKIPRWW